MPHRLEQSIITPNTRVPIYVVLSAASLAIYGTILYMSIASKLDSAMTIQQEQEWIDNAREHNPSIYWPRLPDKHQAENRPDYSWDIPSIP